MWAAISHREIDQGLRKDVDDQAGVDIDQQEIVEKSEQSKWFAKKAG